MVSFARKSVCFLLSVFLVLGSLPVLSGLAYAEEEANGERRSDEFSSEPAPVQGGIGFVYIDEEELALGSEQNIAVVLNDESDVLASARLHIKAQDFPDGIWLSARSVAGNAALFVSSDFSRGIYTLAGVEYVLADGTVCDESLEGGTACSFSVVAGEARAGDGLDEGVSVYGLDASGNLIEGDDVESVAASASLSAAKSLAARSGNPNEPFVVALDPGHGGSDPGAVGNGLKESDLTWSISVACKEALEEYSNVEVVLTRSQNETLAGLDDRVDRALAAGAQVFVSIHINSGGGTGAEVWYPNDSEWKNAETHQKGEKLAESILEKLEALGLYNRGAKVRDWEGKEYPDGTTADYYGVIRHAREAGLLGIIVEHAFIDREADAAKLKDANFLRSLGKADAQGIAEALGLSKGVWKQENGGWRFYEGSSYVTGWGYIADTWYYFDEAGHPMMGWQYLGDSWYYFDPEATGAAKAGLAKIADSWYYFDVLNSYMVSNRWIKDEGKWYWATSGGSLACGPQTVGESQYWFDEETCAALTGWIKRADGWHFADDDGALHSGWSLLGGSWYYFDPEEAGHPALTGLFEVNTELFCADGDGRLYVNRQVEADGKTYWADSRGALTDVSDMEGWLQKGDSWYYYENMRPKAGWIEDEQGWHFCDSDGAALSGWQFLGGTWYYFDPGRVGNPAATGLYQPQGDSRWFFSDDDGRMQRGWIEDDLGWHFAGDNGALYSGWAYLGADWYYFDPGRVGNPAATGLYQPQGDSRWFFSDDDGRMQRGWIRDEGGRWLFAASNGAMSPGWSLLGGSWYYFDPEEAGHPALTGLFEVNTELFCADGDGRLYTSRWLCVEGEWYRYADGRGALNGWANRLGDGSMALVSSDGSALSGWQLVGDSYFLCEEGTGRVLTYWQQVGDAWYFLDPGKGGAMATGWVRPYGTYWYYLNPDGSMATGWLQLGSTWYYLEPEGGVMASDEWVWDGWDWYRVASNGAMQTGWFSDGHDWYYLDSSNGGRALKDGWHWLGEVDYKFSSSCRMVGAWVDVPCLMQYPELPTGCESVALTDMLLYWGYLPTKTTIASSYLPRSSTNFVTAFCGNPFSSGGNWNACCAPAIAIAGNSYLGQWGEHRAVEVTGASQNGIFSYIQNGTPVQVWSTVDCQPSAGSWTGAQWYNGRSYRLFSGTHSVVVSGYDTEEGIVYVSDPLSGSVTRSMFSFFSIYTHLGSQAVVIEER